MSAGLCDGVPRFGLVALIGRLRESAAMFDASRLMDSKCRARLGACGAIVLISMLIALETAMAVSASAPQSSSPTATAVPLATPAATPIAATPTSSAAGRDTDYRLHELPALGGDNAAVVEMNDSGIAVGWSELKPGDEASHATLWAGGAPVDLGTLGGRDSLAAYINDAGEIVGSAEDAQGQSHAVIWREGAITDLGTLGGETSVANAIAPDGSVVGSAELASGDTHAFLWRDGVMTDLGTLGGANSEAYAIASDGRIYGLADTRDGQSHAVRWSEGIATDLGTLGGGTSAALAANADGVAVGWVARPDGAMSAVRWTDQQGAEALDPGDGMASVAASINDAGAIAGSIAPATREMRAVVWVDDRRTQLPGFVDGMSGAFGISRQGVVGGYAADDSARHQPVLWTPEGAPTPTALSPSAPVGMPMASPMPVASPAATPVAGQPCREAVQSDAAQQTRTLTADCTTDRSLFVPDGWSFDGGGHTIYAVDPDQGSLRGGVLMVTGTVGDIRDVTIDGAGLSISCADDHGASGLAGVLYRGAAGTVSGVQVRNMARALPAAAAAGNEIPAGRRSSCGTGIAVNGASARVLIEQNGIENAAFAGILIEEGEASVSHNTIARAHAGIVAAEGARVRISPENIISSGDVGILFEDAGTSGRAAGNTIRTMSRIGIGVIDGAQAAIAGNTILGIDVNGIAVEGPSTHATVDENHLDRPGGVGIKVYQGSAEIRGNGVARGTYGIVASGGATAQIVANSLANQERIGIFIVQEGTNATVAQNRVEDAHKSGIWVEQAARAEITGNRVSRSAGVGIAALDGADVTIAGGNEVSGGRFGISVIGAGTSATVEANAVSEIALTGYSVESGATGHLRENRASGVDGASWSPARERRPTSSRTASKRPKVSASSLPTAARPPRGPITCSRPASMVTGSPAWRRRPPSVAARSTAPPRAASRSTAAPGSPSSMEITSRAALGASRSSAPERRRRSPGTPSRLRGSAYASSLERGRP